MFSQVRHHHVITGPFSNRNPLTPGPSPPRAERAPHLSLDAAVPPVTSAHPPRMNGGNWVSALSRGERAKILTSAPCVQPKIWVKIGSPKGARRESIRAYPSPKLPGDSSIWFSGFRVSPTLVTRTAACPLTGHLVSQIPQPIQRSGSTRGCLIVNFSP